MNDLTSPEGFVPTEELGTYLGRAPRVQARIKEHPSHFVVQEQPFSELLCTVNTRSDIAPGAKNTGRCIAVTVVKRFMTTYDAARELAAIARVDDRLISYPGMKDRTADTSQTFIIDARHLHGQEWQDLFDRITRNSCPEPLREGRGFFIKDVRPFDRPLFEGHLVGNRFTIKVVLPGMSASEIDGYMKPRLKKLQRRNSHWPNFYGRQRLGRRQLNFGPELMANGPREAIKRFLCEVNPNENAAVQQKRRELASEWASAEHEAQQSGRCLEQQWLFWHSMRQILEMKPDYKALNLAVEHQIVEKLLEVLDFHRVMAECRRVFKLWIGAYQSYWFNQALGKLVRGEKIALLEGKYIPLYMKDPAVEKWYRDNGLADAIIPDEQLDPAVRALFLTTPAGRRNPRRRAFVPCLVLPESMAEGGRERLKYQVEDGSVTVEFMLGSGSYATIFLDMFFELIQNDQTLTEAS